MDVPFWVWATTVAALVGIVGVDLFISDRKPHAVTLKEAGIWVGVYVTLAVAFGIGLWMVEGGQVSGEFVAGYLTEYSLSVDNLFVFVIIMTAFAVPPDHRHKVLLFGIVLALMLRGAFIALGAAAIQRFSFTFYVFGAFLIYTAVQLIRSHGEQPHLDRNPALRFVERFFPTTREYHGSKVIVQIDGRRTITPLLIVMIAIGTTDILFALDSIPAIFGLTEEPYIVFTANAFALMGLRQLFFLLDGLLDRLVYLSYGLAFILGFIGVKLILEAAHKEFGDPWPEISIAVSLGVIAGTLIVTTIASLLKVRRDPSVIEEFKAGHGLDGIEAEDIRPRP